MSNNENLFYFRPFQVWFWRFNYDTWCILFRYVLWQYYYFFYVHHLFCHINCTRERRVCIFELTLCIHHTSWFSVHICNFVCYTRHSSSVIQVYVSEYTSESFLLSFSVASEASFFPLLVCLFVCLFFYSSPHIVLLSKWCS